jgi:excisionase family DNA binding protein
VETLLNVRDVAELLRVHTSTVYRLMKSKKLPGFRVGYDWRFQLAEIEKWMKEPIQTERRR